MPQARPFLAEVRELEEKAEGMGNFISLSDAQMIDDGALGAQANGITVTARRVGQPANLVEMPKYQIPRLFTNDRVEAVVQVLNFLGQYFAQRL